MIRLKAFSILFFTCLTINLSAQLRITGLVKDADDGLPLPGALVTLLGELTDQKVSSATHGEFSFTGLKPGQYEVSVEMIGYAKFVSTVHIKEDLFLPVTLYPQVRELMEVKVFDQGNGFGMDRLRAVDGMAIFAGKKSELIIPENLTVNAATNNARQLYSRVAGLNIYENDGAGLQLSIGGRGLDPNRTANFNVRQNGYDISADALGYPESYYTPPVEAIDRIQLVRGAASLQYGTQFGGLLNFILKRPVTDKALEIVSRQTAGSFGFFNSFNSISGTSGKLGYYGFFQYKRGDGWKPNSNFESYTGYGYLKYKFTEKTALSGQYTHMNYLAKQSGGLTDRQFQADPRQSNRSRNWFKVDWNLFNLEFQHDLSPSNKISVLGFGLLASRSSLGFRPNRPETPDNGGPRDLIDGYFANWGAEARFLQRYEVASRPSVLLLGARYYKGFNRNRQGQGSDNSDADFTFVNPEEYMLSDYRFPGNNMAFFAENIFNLSPQFSLTPGFRYEFIKTVAKGYYRNIITDLAGNIIENSRYDESLERPRNFILMGLGMSLKPSPFFELYGNFSQNYRSITFNDIRVVNPSFEIDPNIKDEKGFSADFGIRGTANELLNFDLSAFAMQYSDRIGEVQFDDGRYVKRKRSNIGEAFITGIESYAEVDILRAFRVDRPVAWTFFGNLALIGSEYTDSQIPGVKGKKVEFIPAINLKTGTGLAYKGFKSSLQYSFLSQQYTDATNATRSDATGVIGRIPDYYVWDLSTSYEFKRLKLEASVNNVTDNMYFTRRATGYPGPGILSSDGRSYFITLQVSL